MGFVENRIYTEYIWHDSMFPFFTRPQKQLTYHIKGDKAPISLLS